MSRHIPGLSPAVVFQIAYMVCIKPGGYRVAPRFSFVSPYGAGFITALAFNVTAVCASARPFNVAPVFSTIAVWHNILPLKTDVVPRVVWPATCQKMFLANAPPIRLIWAPLPRLRVCPIWKIQTSVALPERVTSVGIVTPVPHL